MPIQEFWKYLKTIRCYREEQIGDVAFYTGLRCAATEVLYTTGGVQRMSGTVRLSDMAPVFEELGMEHWHSFIEI